MLLITTSEQDASTNDVLDWLYFLAPDTDIVRLNNDRAVTSVSYSLSNEGRSVCFETDNGQNVEAAINASWYRRGSLAVAPAKDGKGIVAGKIPKLGKSLMRHLSIETRYIDEAIDLHLGSLAASINKFADNRTNKITNLTAAAKAGLKIPATLVTNNITDLLQFCTKWGKVITKAIAYNRCTVLLEGEEVILSSDTSLLTVADVKKLEPIYQDKKPLPALYQQYVDKEIELRIFFLYGDCYAMAIFSQNDEQTKIDFRNYNIDRPNRCIPYSLPEDIRRSIINFMEAVDMNCGSIDMIVTPQGDYVFLEVNPIGQYQWLERNCNYPISKNIAKKLAEYA